MLQKRQGERRPEGILRLRRRVKSYLSGIKRSSFHAFPAAVSGPCEWTCQECLFCGRRRITSSSKQQGASKLDGSTMQKTGPHHWTLKLKLRRKQGGFLFWRSASIMQRAVLRYLNEISDAELLKFPTGSLGLLPRSCTGFSNGLMLKRVSSRLVSLPLRLAKLPAPRD